MLRAKVEHVADGALEQVGLTEAHAAKRNARDLRLLGKTHGLRERSRQGRISR